MANEILSRDMERTLVRKALQGDADARNRLIVSMLPFIHQEAGRITVRSGCDTDDLVQAAVMRITEHFARFNPRRNVRPITYFGTAARRAMWEYARHRTQLIYVPNMTRESRRDDVARARSVRSLSDRLGESPDASELGETVADGKAVMPEERTVQAERVALLRRCLNKLPPKLRGILRDRMQGLTLHAIGKKHGVSKEAIRQMETRAKERLAAMMI